jgi:hypothetical protein
MIACAINERVQRKLDYTQEEVRVLKEIVAALTGGGRISFTADERRRLAVAGKALSPEEWKKCCQIVMPGTLGAAPDGGVEVRQLGKQGRSTEEE